MERLSKKVSQSTCTHSQIVLSSHINGANRLFGGQLMAWIDIVAGIVARRHSNRDVTTACVDSLDFKAKAEINDVVILKGKITHAGRTSMEVRVDTFVESLQGVRTLINQAYLVLVAIDENGKPTEVPLLIPETDEEKQEFAKALERKEFRKRKEL